MKIELTKEAKEKCISISELCRQKLGNNSQLDGIEGKIDRIFEKD